MNDAPHPDLEVRLARLLDQLDLPPPADDGPGDEMGGGDSAGNSGDRRARRYLASLKLPVAELDEDQAARFHRAQAGLAAIHRARRHNALEDPAEPRPAGDPATLADIGTPDTWPDQDESNTIQFRQGLPARLGRFVIDRELGRGGFGVVLLARDPKLGRQVALKIPRAEALIDTESRRRFEREAQSAAILSHPAIIPIYEAGRVGPISYIAFEYCEGVTLAEWLAAGNHRRPWRLAARIVSRLADAVGHAHRRGVIHRDLKPGNVLLNVCGDLPSADDRVAASARITDFGLAKLVAGQTPRLTRAGATIGTPAYMAPEQAAGREPDVGPPVDIYALGAILYELVTGRPPIQKDSDLATLRAVEAEEPLAVRRHNPSVPRDLEAICHRCLQKDPARRYPAARDLESDLERLLSGQPVLARRAGAAERLWRWCRRRPVAAAWLATLVISFVTVTVLWVQADRSRRVAVEQRHEAQRSLQAADENLRLARSALDDYARRISDDLRLQEADLRPLRQQLLEQVVPFYENLIARYASDPAVQAERGDAYLQLGRITAEIGSQERAIALFESAAAIFDHLVAAHPGTADHAAQLGESLNRAAWLYQKTGRHDEAAAYYARAMRLLESLVDEHPNRLDYRRCLAESYNDCGHQFLQNRDFEKAEALFHQAIALRESLSSEDAQPDQHWLPLAGLHVNIGNIYLARHHYERAEFEYREARGLLEQLVRQHPADANAHYVLGMTLLNLGEVLKHRQQKADAESCYRSALDIVSRVASQHPSVTRYQEALALVLHNLGDLAGLADRDQEAESCFERARELNRSLVGAHPANVQYRHNLAITTEWLGGIYRRTGRMELAAQTYDEAAAAFARIAEIQPARTDLDQRYMNAKANNVRCVQELGRFAEADDGIETILDYVAARKAAGTTTADDELHRAGLHEDLAILCYDVGRPEQALEHLQTARVALERLVAEQPRNVEARIGLASVDYQVGRSRRAMGRAGEAISSFDRVVAVTDACRNHPGHREIWCTTYWERALAHAQLEQFQVAVEDFARALEFDDGTHRPRLRALRATALAQTGDHRSAAAEAQRVGAQHDLGPKTLYNLGCAMGQAMIALSADGQLDAAERTTARDDYAHAALEFLRRAADAGYFGHPQIDAMLHAPELRDLLPTPDFKTLLDALRRRAS